MILNQDIKPEKSAYYLGSMILSVLKEDSSEVIDLLDLFEAINRHEKVSYHAFSIAMNWLYLIGALDLQERQLVKCF